MTNKISIKNRMYCDVLTEMRSYIPHLKIADSKKDFLFSMVEELQTYGNRMEAAIYDYKDVLKSFKTLSKIRAKIRREQTKLEKLKEDLKTLKAAKKKAK